jgi:hypothetical protein
LVLQPTTVEVGWLSRGDSVKLGGVEDSRGHASEAGEEMGSELDAIQERLQALKRRLDARQSVVAFDDPEIASGDAVSMNPLTASDPPG